jgi:cell wall-associated NlpC family hydrolase
MIPGRSFRVFYGAIALGTAAVSGACASSGGTPRPFPMPGIQRPDNGSPSISSATHGEDDIYALVGTALDLRGIPYRNGGADPSGFDCSGFTQYVFAQHGVALPREVREQFSMGSTVKPHEVAAGDLVFFSTTAHGPSHVVIAVGGEEFIHAPSSAGVVRVERFSSSYWSKRFVGARRIW